MGGILVEAVQNQYVVSLSRIGTESERTKCEQEKKTAYVHPAHQKA